MAEYIERELLVKYLEEKLEAHGNPCMVSKPIARGIRLGISYALSLARTLQASDVVEVVRCKDCVYRVEPSKMCAHPKAVGWDALEPDDDDFCSYGERKE